MAAPERPNYKLIPHAITGLADRRAAALSALFPRELEPLAQDTNAFEHVRALPVKQIRVDRVNPAVANRGNGL
jgi:hypothetical protein